MSQVRDTRLIIPFRKPKNPGDTRWDSQLDTMESVLHLKAAIEDLETTEAAEWEDKNLTRNEWKLMEGAVKLLKPFKETTKVLQYESIPTINLVIDRVYCMEEFLTEFIGNRANDKFGITFAKELKKNLEKRFPNHGTNVFEIRAANFLDPHFKGIHLRKFKQLDSTKQQIEECINDALENPDEVMIPPLPGETNNNREVDQGNMSPTHNLPIKMIPK